MLRIRFWALFAALVLAYADPAAAFKMTPIEAEFSAGRQAMQTFKIENPGTQPVAIELTVHQRDMATDGSDVLTAAPDAFTVFPDQIVLQPGQTQSVRVQWLGQDVPAAEMAYRLQAEQLPIDIGSDAGERSGLRLLVKYMASLYVRPDDPAAALSASIAEGEREGRRVAIVRLRNDGNAHAVVQAPMLSITAGGAPVAYTEAQRDAIHGRNVLAGVERELVLPWAPNLDAGPLAVTLVPPAD
jgi:fimbrial chaperone protein